MLNEAFWEWFGDSKVVDEKGQPLVVYHGTKREFTRFDMSRVGRGAGSSGQKAFFFTKSVETARWYSRAVSGRGQPVLYPVYLRVQNPLVSPLEGYPGAKAMRYLLSAARKAGHDGIFFPRMQHQWERDQIAVFSPTQIKSATANRGTWSPTDPDITRNS